MARTFVPLLAILLTAYPSPPQKGAGLPLQRIAVIDLPGPDGKRFGYLALDSEDHYLLVAHLGADQTYVIDVATNEVVATITGTPGAEGIEYIPGLKKVYTSNAGDDTIGVIDLGQRKVVNKIPTGQKPDGSAYAASFHKLYVSNERARTVSVVDVVTDTLTNTLHFDSETGIPQFDPVSEKVYVNLPDQNLLAVIDPRNDGVVARYPVSRCKGNHGMALAPDSRRAFLVCEASRHLAVFDLDKHVAIAWIPLPPGGDVVKFDPGIRRIYVACYSGAVSVIQMDGPNTFRKIADVPVSPKVRSLAVDPDSHRVYVPEEEEDGAPVARLVVYDSVVVHKD